MFLELGENVQGLEIFSHTTRMRQLDIISDNRLWFVVFKVIVNATDVISVLNI